LKNIHIWSSLKEWYLLIWWKSSNQKWQDFHRRNHLTTFHIGISISTKMTSKGTISCKKIGDLFDSFLEKDLIHLLAKIWSGIFLKLVIYHPNLADFVEMDTRDPFLLFILHFKRWQIIIVLFLFLCVSSASFNK